MTDRILCVDDEPLVLEAYQRVLRKSFQVDTACGGEEGLNAFATRGPYAVVVSDMRMPGMDGVQFLSRVKALDPEAVRMILTGDTDLNTAILAVNDGSVFRFLRKPCDPDTLGRALIAGLEQHRLVVAEKELIENTLSGAIKVLTDILSLANPTAFGRASRLKPLVTQLAAILEVENVWEIEVATMLSHVGCVAVPEETLMKLYNGTPLTPQERRMYQEHPNTGYELIARIPRLEAVGQIIAYQEKLFNGEGLPHDAVCGADIPLGARILKLALDFDRLVSSGCSKTNAIKEIEGRQGWYDPRCIDALMTAVAVAVETRYVAGWRTVGDLTADMMVADDILSLDGLLLVAKDQQITPSLHARLVNMVSNQRIPDPIKVLVPITQ